MAGLQGITFALSCTKSQEVYETKTSVTLKTLAIALGVIALAVGLMAHYQIPLLSSIGSTGSWAALSAGAGVILLGLISLTLKYKKEAVSETPQLSLEKQKILDDYGPLWFDLLSRLDDEGRLDKDVDFNEREYPVAIGTRTKRNTEARLTDVGIVFGGIQTSPSLSITYLKYKDDQELYVIVHDVYTRWSDGHWNKFFETSDWQGDDPVIQNDLYEPWPDIESYMVDRVKRLINGEAVGAKKRFMTDESPADAYLDSDSLEKYRTLAHFMYERKSKEGSTDLFLFEPGLTLEENAEKFFEKFPEQKSMKIRHGDEVEEFFFRRG